MVSRRNKERPGFKTNKKKTKEGKKHETIFILDTIEDHNLQKNFLALEEDNKDSYYRYNDPNNKEQNSIV